MWPARRPPAARDVTRLHGRAKFLQIFRRALQYPLTTRLNDRIACACATAGADVRRSPLSGQVCRLPA